MLRAVAVPVCKFAGLNKSYHWHSLRKLLRQVLQCAAGIGHGEVGRSEADDVESGRAERRTQAHLARQIILRTKNAQVG